MQVKTLRTFKSVTSFLKGYFKNNLNEYIILKKKKNWQKTTKFCKAIILQLKNKLKKKNYTIISDVIL